MSFDCSGCHGSGGGGGTLTNEVWIYGDDDDTLFRLIAPGPGSLSPGDAFGKQGFVRKGCENIVVRPMPPFGETFKTDTEIWKIIAWIRSVTPSPFSEGVRLRRLVGGNSKSAQWLKAIRWAQI
jgi:Cytochrome C oxidase, cbb3-type, subunit III